MQQIYHFKVVDPRFKPFGPDIWMSFALGRNPDDLHAGYKPSWKICSVSCRKRSGRFAKLTLYGFPVDTHKISSADFLWISSAGGSGFPARFLAAGERGGREWQWVLRLPVASTSSPPAHPSTGRHQLESTHVRRRASVAIRLPCRTHLPSAQLVLEE